MQRGRKTNVEKENQEQSLVTSLNPEKEGLSHVLEPKRNAGLLGSRNKTSRVVKKETINNEDDGSIIEGSSLPSPTETQETLNLEDVKPHNSQALVAHSSIDTCQIIRDLPCHDSKWPKFINSHVDRRFFSISQENPKTNLGEAKFLHESKDHCIICKQKNDQEVISCRGHINGLLGSGKVKLDCRSVFHLDCITKYNASDFYITYIAQQECQNEVLCPLHFCDTCFFERKKQTAFMGKLIECALCTRAFHYDNCTPIGCKDLELTLDTGDNNKYKIEMVICPAHRPPKEVKGTSHLPCCCECEKDKPGVELVQCRTCIRSYHFDCRTAETIDGKPVPLDTCEFCLTGECVRFDASVIARWTDNKFYPAMTRDWSKCPMKLRRSNNYDQLGFCTLEWKGESNQFSIIPIADCVPIFGSSISFLGKKMKSNFLKAWQELINESEENKQYHPLLKEVRKRFETSRYATKEGEKAAPFKKEDPCFCDCPENLAKRCHDESCSNRREYYECPADCKNCLNREITSRVVNKKCERRETTHKGYGVFAVAPIKKGEFIAEYAGEIINKAEIEKRTTLIEQARDLEANLYIMSLPNGRAIDAARAGNIARYINHSCEPNCSTIKRTIVIKQYKDKVVYDHRIAVVAIKDIKAEEELSFTYMMDAIDLKNTVTPMCRCGAKRCAGNLGGKARNVSDDESDNTMNSSEDEEEEEEEQRDVKPPKIKKSRAPPKIVMPKEKTVQKPVKRRTSVRNEGATISKKAKISEKVGKVGAMDIINQKITKNVEARLSSHEELDERDYEVFSRVLRKVLKEKAEFVQLGDAAFKKMAILRDEVSVQDLVEWVEKKIEGDLEICMKDSPSDSKMMIEPVQEHLKSKPNSKKKPKLEEPEEDDHEKTAGPSSSRVGTVNEEPLPPSVSQPGTENKNKVDAANEAKKEASITSRLRRRGQSTGFITNVPKKDEKEVCATSRLRENGRGRSVNFFTYFPNAPRTMKSTPTDSQKKS